MTIASFHHLGLIEELTRSLDENNYKTPTPIQQSAISSILENQDLLGVAQTGTGKTAAFALPVLQQLFTTPYTPKPCTTRALILAPTNELVIQIADNCEIYAKYLSLRQATIYGGVKQKQQIQAMSEGVDLLIATPGRLLDLVQQGHVDLSSVTHLVLDEADRMLATSILQDISKIMLKIPKKRQTLLFSATMPSSISKLTDRLLNKPKKVNVTPEAVTVIKIKQSVYKIPKKNKRALLATLLQNEDISKMIIFSRTREGANRIVKELEHAGISTAVIHGKKTQLSRQKALDEFKKGEVRTLVATDIVARGIDVENISHVINYDLPSEPETYVHRIGRTARAGTSGTAISFCDETEGKTLKLIERIIKYKIPISKTPYLIKVEPIIEEARERKIVVKKNTSNARYKSKMKKQRVRLGKNRR